MLMLACLIAAFAGLIFGFVFWRQKHGLYAILEKGARGYDELRKRTDYLDRLRTQHEEQLIELRKREDANRASLSQMAARAADAEQELTTKVSEVERRLRNAELQRDHILNVHDNLVQKHLDQSQVKETLEATILGLESECEKLTKAAMDAQVHAAHKLKQENNQLRQNLQKLEAELKLLKERSDVNPRDFDTLRRKVGQYEMLYTGMKSLRDMTDERNKNWESALRRLATWVLTSSSVARANDPVVNANFGPLVAEALQRIGGGLLEVDQAEELEAERLLVNELDQRAGAHVESSRSLS